MSFLTALLDQQASKTQPELPVGGDTKRLPASKSLPALKPSASSSSLQVVNIEVPSSDLNILLEKPLGSRRRGSLKSTLARARESQRAEEEAQESAADRKARQMREARARARRVPQARVVARRRGAHRGARRRCAAEAERRVRGTAVRVALDGLAQPHAGGRRRRRRGGTRARRLAFVHTLSLDPTNTRAHLGFGAALAGIRRQRYSWPVPPKGTWEPRTTSLRGRQGRRPSAPRAREHAAACGDGAAAAGAAGGRRLHHVDDRGELARSRV